MSGIKTIIFIAGAVASAIGLGVVTSAIDNSDHEARTILKNNLESNDKSYQDMITEIETAIEALSQIKAIKDEEERKLTSKVNEYKSSIGFTDRVKDSKTEVIERLNDFKESIGYEESKARIESDYQNRISQLKSDRHYTEGIAKAKETIKKANQAYEASTILLSDDEVNAKSKRASMDARDKTINSANEKIEELENWFKKKSKKARNEADNRLKELNDQVEAKRAELTKASEKALEPLALDVSDKRMQFRKEIIGSRDETEADLISMEPAFVASKKRNEECSTLLVEKRYRGMNLTDKLVAYLRYHNVKKPTILVAGLASAIPLFYATYKWVKIIFDVASKI